ncbi:MAG: hypothetical protein WCY93_07890 [Anaerolineaceae bacterium]
MKSPDPFDLKGCFIAGGAILSQAMKTEIADYDVYPKTRKDAENILYGFLEDKSAFVVNITDNAVTLKCNNILNKDGTRAIVQIMVLSQFKTAQDIFDRFDFTVCMGAYDCDTKEFHYGEHFWEDVASRTLRFNPGTYYPLNSLTRVNKYLAKGFKIGKAEIVRMGLTAIAQGLPKSWEDLEAQIGGQYGRAVKIGADDRPFTLETALEILSDFDLNIEEVDRAEEYTGKETDHLIDMALKTPRKYVELDQPNMILVRGTEVLVIGGNDEVIYTTEKKNILPSWTKFEGRLRGYKTMKETEDPNVFLPGVFQGRTDIIYKLGEETEQEKSPNLYVYSSRDVARGLLPPKSVSTRVSFDSKDVLYAESDRVLRVKKLKLEEVLDNGK